MPTQSKRIAKQEQSYFVVFGEVSLEVAMSEIEMDSISCAQLEEHMQTALRVTRRHYVAGYTRDPQILLAIEAISTSCFPNNNDPTLLQVAALLPGCEYIAGALYKLRHYDAAALPPHDPADGLYGNAITLKQRYAGLTGHRNAVAFAAHLDINNEVY